MNTKCMPVKWLLVQSFILILLVPVKGYAQDDAGGTVIGIITTTTSCIGSWDYDLPFSTGLVMVTTGNSLDATVVYE